MIPPVITQVTLMIGGLPVHRDILASCGSHSGSNRPCPNRVLGPRAIQCPDWHTGQYMRPGEQFRSNAPCEDPNPCCSHGFADPNPCASYCPVSSSLRVLGPEPVLEFPPAEPQTCDNVGCHWVQARPRGILSVSTTASKKLARHGGRIVAFSDQGCPNECREVHLTLLNACRPC